jgi:tetratricopeptide (TPR) repeat protein
LAILDGASVDLAAKLAEPHDPAETWRSLETQCLITVHDDGPRKRYRVPHPIAFAIRNMADAGDREAIEAKTWSTVSDWALEKSRLMAGPNQEYAFNAVQAELSNLKKGLEWAIDANPALACHLVVGTWRTVCARGNPSDDAELLLRAVQAGSRYQDTIIAGEAWVGTAVALDIAGFEKQAEGAYLEALKVYEAAGHVDGHAWASINYAEIVAHTDLRRAIQMAKEATDTTQTLGLRTLGLSFYAKGLAELGETEEAVRVGEEVFGWRLQSPNLTEQARAYGELAQLYRMAGRPEAAEPLLREGIRRLRETGIQDVLLETLQILGEVCMDSPDNREVLAEATALANRIGSNVKLLEVARARMTWTSGQGDLTGMIVAVEDMFRFTQISQSAVQRDRSLRALASELRRNGKPEYANSIDASLGETVDGPIHTGWRSLLSSDSHGTVCVLAVVMAKEALSPIPDRGR